MSIFVFAKIDPVYANQPAKPRVIAMTDGEIDDRCSMIRFLLYSNDMDIAAIIQTNSVFQEKGWSSEKWLEKQDVCEIRENQGKINLILYSIQF